LITTVKHGVACRFPDRNPLPVPRLAKVPPQGLILGSAKGEFTVPDHFNDGLPKKIEDLFG
jgi:hypothetical protein